MHAKLNFTDLENGEEEEEAEEDENEDSIPETELDDNLCLQEKRRREIRLMELHKLAFERYEDPEAMIKVKAHFHREFPDHDEALLHMSGSKWGHLEKLKDLWRKVSPEQFKEMIVSAGPKAGLVMNAFTVSVQERNPLYCFNSSSVGITMGDFNETTPCALSLGASGPSHRCCLQGHRVKQCIFWSGLHFDPHDGTVFALKALAESSEDSDIFGTPLGQAVLQHNWRLARWYFLSRRLMDVILVLALIWLSYFSCRSQKPHSALPGKLQINFMLLLCVYNACQAVVDLRACLFIYGSLRPYTYAWNMFCWALSLCSSLGLLCGLWPLGTLGDPKITNIKDTFFFEHPIALSFVLLAKWCELGVHMLNVELLAETVLPAWMALRSRVSLTFIAWLLYLIAGSGFAYMALPIKDQNYDEWRDAFREAIIRMLRLNLMADFDMVEMEGLEKHIQHLNITNITSGSGDITDSGAISQIHDDLRYSIVFLGVLFPVTLLNVYITMVGNAYSAACDRILETKGRFKMMSMVPPLMTQLLCIRLARSLGSKARRGPAARGGLWISVPEGLFTSGPAAGPPCAGPPDARARQ